MTLWIISILFCENNTSPNQLISDKSDVKVFAVPVLGIVWKMLTLRRLPRTWISLFSTQLDIFWHFVLKLDNMVFNDLWFTVSRFSVRPFLFHLNIPYTRKKQLKLVAVIDAIQNYFTEIVKFWKKWVRKTRSYLNSA